MITKELIEKAKEFALNEIEKFGLPSIINFNTSNQKGQIIAEELNTDKNLVLVGTILMDIKLGECFKEKKLTEHVERSVSATKKFLERFNLDKETKEKIINCVEAHHGTKEFTCKEAEICANADCYRFIYPKNVFAYIAGNVKNGLSVEDSLENAYNKLEEKHKILSLDTCKEELEPYYKTFKDLIQKAMEK